MSLEKRENGELGVRKLANKTHFSLKNVAKSTYIYTYMHVPYMFVSKKQN